MAFVVVSRTALVTMPIMLAVFALLHLKWRSVVIIILHRICIGGSGVGGLASFAVDDRDIPEGLPDLQELKSNRHRSAAAGILEKYLICEY